MNWYRTIKFSQSTYGYWVTPQARRIPVGSLAGHYDALIDAGFPNNNQIYSAALSTGWVRIISALQPGSIQLWKRPTSQQLGVIEAIMMENKQRRVVLSSPWYVGEVNDIYDLEKALMGRLRSPKKLLQQKPDYVGEPVFADPALGRGQPQVPALPGNTSTSDAMNAQTSHM